MLAVTRIFILIVLAFAAGNWAVLAQDIESPEYAENYERLQEIVKISDPAKKAEQLVAFYKGRSNLNPQLKAYADSNFGNALKDLMSSPDLVKKFAQGVLAVRPKFGEALFFYGIALKRDGKMDEALEALAKSSLIESTRQNEAKQQLELAYREANKNLVGLDKFVAKIKAEMK
jgi:hypothetical protein